MSGKRKTNMRIKKATRITRIESEFDRGRIHGDADSSFASLELPGMQFEGDESRGYFYDNWTTHSLKELSDAILAFLAEHEEGRKLLDGEKQPVNP